MSDAHNPFRAVAEVYDKLDTFFCCGHDGNHLALDWAEFVAVSSTIELCWDLCRMALVLEALGHMDRSVEHIDATLNQVSAMAEAMNWDVVKMQTVVHQALKSG